MAEKFVGLRCKQIVSKRKQKTRLKWACICTICKVHSNLPRVPVIAHQLEALLVKDPSLLCVVWRYGHVLQVKRNTFREPTTCQRQRIFMNENQTGDILLIQVSKPNSMQCCEMFSALVLGYTVLFQINRTSEISTCKHWRHLPFHTYSRSILTSYRHILWQVLKIVLRSPQIWKKCLGNTPPPPPPTHKALAFGTRDNALPPPPPL